MGTSMITGRSALRAVTESFPQTFVAVQPDAHGTINLGQLGEVRVVESRADDPAAETLLLVVVRRTQHLVIEHQGHHVYPFLDSGGQFTGGVPEPAVPCCGNDLPPGVANLGAQGRGEGIPQGGEVGRCEVGTRGPAPGRPDDSNNRCQWSPRP